MEKARKNLRISSIVILIFAGLSLINIVAQLIWGDFSNAPIPDGSSDNILLIAKTVLLGISLLLLIPDVYIGVKGLKAAKNPSSSKGHIVWATILFVLSIIALISPILGLFSGDSVRESISAILSCLVQILIYFEYIRDAKRVAKLN
jgi:uncharacterized membrane protein YhaH (DUF805 family)